MCFGKNIITDSKIINSSVPAEQNCVCVRETETPGREARGMA